MADRRPAKPARRPGASPVGDAPLVDLIFPNREQPRERGFEPTASQLDRAAGFGPPERDTFQHRKVGRLARLFGRANTRRRSVRAIPGITDRPVRRRRVLPGVGTGVVVASGVGGAAALLTGAFGSDDTPNKLNTAAGLGAAGLADSPSDAARIAASATPAYPTPLGRDPELHLLRRASFG